MIAAATAALIIAAGGWWAVTQLGDSGSGAPSSPPSDSASGELSVLNTNDFHSLAVSPIDPNLVLYGHHGGVLRSTDGGRSWQQTNLTGPTDDAMGMAFAGPGGSMVFAAGHDTFFKSTNAGADWQNLNVKLPGTDVHGMSVAPDNPDRLYANVVRFGLYRSDDGGKTWIKANTATYPGDVIQVSASAGDTVFVASVEGGVLRSDDAGETFRPTGRLEGAALTVAAYASGPMTVYAGTQSGLFASTDGGVTWTERTPPGGGQAMASAVSPTEPGDVTVVMVREDGVGHVFRSRNSGATWTEKQP